MDDLPLENYSAQHLYGEHLESKVIGIGNYKE